MKHYFLGGNTPHGFVSYYNKANAGGNRLFILKGGSGVGKHTFMKKIANKYEAEGLEVEYCHCSNDVNSLDGIMLPSLGVGIIDGTAPHMTDPTIPAAFDEIIDLGKYIDRDMVVGERDRIAMLSGKKKELYSHAYAHLAAAKAIHQDTDRLIMSCVNEQRFTALLQSLPKSIGCQTAKGNKRDVFASAYTSSGYVDYIGTLVEGKTVAIWGHACLNRRLMGEIYSWCTNSKATVCHSIVDPTQIDHLLFEGKSVISIDEHNKFNEADELIDIRDVVNKDKLMDACDMIRFNNGVYDQLVNHAISLMAACGKYHSELESIYIPAMDFVGVDEELQRTMEKIDSYIL